MSKTKQQKTKQTMRKELALASFAVGLGINAQALAEPYTITDLGTLGGHNVFLLDAEAWDVNDSGQVVGASVNVQGYRRAFFYNNGQMQDLGTLGGGNQSIAYGINNDGHIVGEAEALSFFPTPEPSAFLYQNGQMQNLGTNAFGDLSAATGVNNAGDVVGWQGPITDDLFLYSNGVKQFLGIRGVYGSGISINNQGQIAGTMALAMGGAHAFLYENGGQLIDLGTLGGTDSYAFGINNNGQVVGYSYASPGSATAHAFLYENGQMKDLGTLEGFWTEAWDINDSGQVVGWAQSSGNGGSRAFLYSNGQMLDLSLNGLLPQNSGWILYKARAISNTGFIVGDGVHNGNARAFLLKPNLQANAGPDQVVNEGVQVALTGAASESYCPSSSSSPCPGYQWLQTGGTPVTLSGADTYSPKFTAPSLSSGAQEVLSFKLTVADGLSNTAEDSVSITVNDVADAMPPVITPQVNGILGQNGWYVSDVTVSWDVIDSESTVSFMNGCGATVIGADTLGDTLTCEAGSAGGNSSQSVTIKRDTTPPTLQALSPISVEATGSSGAGVSFNPSATDATSGVQGANCTPSSGSIFPLGLTPVSCTATDNAGNSSASGSFNVTVADTTPPSITCPANVTASSGQPVNLGNLTASDLVDAFPSISNNAPGSFPLGTTTVTWTATDNSGNSASCQQTVTIAAQTTYNFQGFFQPVDNPPSLNTVKSGATVPVKWRLLDATGNYITDTSTVTESKYAVSTCGGTEDAIEETVPTGGTGLRWDNEGQQFVYNWKTPSLAGKCVRLDVKFNDGSTKSANFKLK